MLTNNKHTSEIFINKGTICLNLINTDAILVLSDHVKGEKNSLFLEQLYGTFDTQKMYFLYAEKGTGGKWKRVSDRQTGTIKEARSWKHRFKFSSKL